jgi:glycosyltransferase involved in cell wall biosynthesis
MSRYRIGILTTPISNAGVIPLSDLITIISSITHHIVLITGGEGYEFFRNDKRLKVLKISHSYNTFFVKRILDYLFLQLIVSYYIFTTRKHTDIFIFFIACDTMLLPMVTAHLLRKKVLLLFASSSIKTHASNNDPLLYGLKILYFLTCTIADRLIVYTDTIARDYSLERWAGKIAIARHHYINFDRFTIKTEYVKRECIVGFVGRFSKEKGVLQLLQAIPGIVRKKPEVKFLFIGDGVLRPAIEHTIFENNLEKRVILPGWVPHDKLADHLNQMKLLVIPSDTEGLPNIMLEAMACGTPVLATPVGGIPYFILPGKTGFILKNNSPDSITSDIIRILEDKNPAEIIKNANQVIQKNFTFETRIEEFKAIFDAVI